MYQDLGILVSGTLFSQPKKKKQKTQTKKQKKKKKFSGTLSISLNDKIFSCRIKNCD